MFKNFNILIIIIFQNVPAEYLLNIFSFLFNANLILEKIFKELDGKE